MTASELRPAFRLADLAAAALAATDDNDEPVQARLLLGTARRLLQDALALTNRVDVGGRDLSEPDRDTAADEDLNGAAVADELHPSAAAPITVQLRTDRFREFRDGGLIDIELVGPVVQDVAHSNSPSIGDRSEGSGGGGAGRESSLTADQISVATKWFCEALDEAIRNSQ